MTERDCQAPAAPVGSDAEEVAEKLEVIDQCVEAINRELKDTDRRLRGIDGQMIAIQGKLGIVELGWGCIEWRMKMIKWGSEDIRRLLNIQAGYTHRPQTPGGSSSIRGSGADTDSPEDLWEKIRAIAEGRDPRRTEP
jgi:hypothetical protein